MTKSQLTSSTYPLTIPLPVLLGFFVYLFHRIEKQISGCNTLEHLESYTIGRKETETRCRSLKRNFKEAFSHSLSMLLLCVVCAAGLLP